MDRRTRNVLVVIAAVFAVGVACDSSDTDTESVYIATQVTLVNNSEADVHLLAPGESMSSANRVPPGGSRTVTVQIDIEGIDTNLFPFRVERPEGQLGQVTCQSNEAGGTKRVVWTGSSLTCEGW